MFYLKNICNPALLYLLFSVTQIIIDTFNRMYNTALVKFVVSIIFTYILNLMCNRGLTLISWIIVFIPFILMSVITTMLLLVLGLSPLKGKIKTFEYSKNKDNDMINSVNNVVITHNNINTQNTTNLPKKNKNSYNKNHNYKNY